MTRVLTWQMTWLSSTSSFSAVARGFFGDTDGDPAVTPARSVAADGVSFAKKWLQCRVSTEASLLY
ncbi:hypothetical protein A2U01_0037891 [Trifolium medium]|uniref:Uncharacterized protein n=1 Tax=Trifolium medium TaxID=97028 RepID=A0A392PYF4_9FABA|nr:hypothetical protein [Trifolium medium]